MEQLKSSMSAFPALSKHEAFLTDMPALVRRARALLQCHDELHQELANESLIKPDLIKPDGITVDQYCDILSQRREILDEVENHLFTSRSELYIAVRLLEEKETVLGAKMEHSKELDKSEVVVYDDTAASFQKLDLETELAKFKTQDQQMNADLVSFEEKLLEKLYEIEELKLKNETLLRELENQKIYEKHEILLGRHQLLQNLQDQEILLSAKDEQLTALQARLNEAEQELSSSKKKITDLEASMVSIKPFLKSNENRNLPLNLDSLAQMNSQDLKLEYILMRTDYESVQQKLHELYILLLLSNKQVAELQTQLTEASISKEKVLHLENQLQVLKTEHDSLITSLKAERNPNKNNANLSGRKTVEYVHLDSSPRPRPSPIGPRPSSHRTDLHTDLNHTQRPIVPPPLHRDHSPRPIKHHQFQGAAHIPSLSGSQSAETEQVTGEMGITHLLHDEVERNPKCDK
jgi:hypothetical protein